MSILQFQTPKNATHMCSVTATCASSEWSSVTESCRACRDEARQSESTALNRGGHGRASRAQPPPAVVLKDKRVGRAHRPAPACIRKGRCGHPQDAGAAATAYRPFSLARPGWARPRSRLIPQAIKTARPAQRPCDQDGTAVLQGDQDGAAGTAALQSMPRNGLAIRTAQPPRPQRALDGHAVAAGPPSHLLITLGPDGDAVLVGGAAQATDRERPLPLGRSQPLRRSRRPTATAQRGRRRIPPAAASPQR